MSSSYKDFQFGICPENGLCGIFLIDGVLRNISAGRHSIFPDILLTTTSSSSFPKQRLVVRQHRFALPLATSRF
jgi:hypothetical protein